MIEAQNAKSVTGLAPISTNSGAVTPLAVDTLGYAYAVATVSFGVIGSAATVMRLTECETSGGTYTAITGLTASGSTGDTRLPQTTDAGKLCKFFLPVSGIRKRYLNLELTTGSTTLASVTFDLYRGEQSPQTSTEKGLAGMFILG